MSCLFVFYLSINENGSKLLKNTYFPWKLWLCLVSPSRIFHYFAQPSWKMFKWSSNVWMYSEYACMFFFPFCTMFRQRTWEYLFLSVEELCEIYFDWFRKLGIKLCKATKFLNGFLYHNESSVWYNTVLT